MLFLKSKIDFFTFLNALIVQIKEFADAKHPAIPFTLRIEGNENINEGQKLSNRKTNEELSISHKGWMGTEIKRMLKQKENSLPKP